MGVLPMTRHIACLTFDFDVISSWINRGLTTPTPISRGEFGLVGAERIMALLERHGIRATWFVPGHTLDTFPEICRRIHDGGHEIGHHGYLHEPPATLTREKEEAVLARGIESIRAVTGAVPRGYRSPSWDLSPHSVDLLLRRGFLYDSSMMAHDDQPYRTRQGDEIGLDGRVRWGRRTRLIEMPVSWSLDDFPHFEYRRTETYLQPGLMHAESVLDNWIADFRFMVENVEWGVLTYTFHPQVVGRGHRMIALERLIQKVSELGGSFSRMDEVAEEFDRQAPFGE